MIILHIKLNKMNLINLFLKVSYTGIITFSKLVWITSQQVNFNRLKESIALRLGRIIDSGIINIGGRLTS